MSSQRARLLAARRGRERTATSRARASSPEPAFSPAISKPADPPPPIASPHRRNAEPDAGRPMFPARSWREEIRDPNPLGVGSFMSAADLAQYQASKTNAGPDSPQRLARRFTATEQTMDTLSETRSKISAVRDMIRRFPQEPLDNTPHNVWIQNYAAAPRYDHIDHGPWVGSPKGSSAALFPTPPSRQW